MLIRSTCPCSKSGSGVGAALEGAVWDSWASFGHSPRCWIGKGRCVVPVGCGEVAKGFWEGAWCGLGVGVVADGGCHTASPVLGDMPALGRGCLFSDGMALHKAEQKRAWVRVCGLKGLCLNDNDVLQGLDPCKEVIPVAAGCLACAVPFWM